MDKLLRTLISLKEAKWGGRGSDDDDGFDRLSRRYSSSLFALFAVVVTTKQFVGEPISCWCPAYFTDSHRHYTNTICWISNTFFVPFETRVPDVVDAEWKSRQLVCYYQWVPLILLTMSVMSLAPGILWSFLSQRSGVDVASLMVSAAAGQQAGYAELRDRTVRYVVNQLAYLGNAIGQLFLLEYFLGFDYVGYGFRAAFRAVRGEDWRLGDSFPRVTLCAFQIRHQARVHDYIVQCALTINLFNEKIFVIVWFWLVFVALATVFGLVRWSVRFMYWPAQLRYVRRRLRDFDAAGCAQRQAKTTLTKFVEYYMRRDGLLIVRLMAINVGELAAVETLAGLWENYGPDKRHLGVQSGAVAGGAAGQQADAGLKRRRQTLAPGGGIDGSSLIINRQNSNREVV